MILEGFFAGLIGNVLKELATQAILKKFHPLDKKEVEQIVATYLAQQQTHTQAPTILKEVYIILGTSGFTGPGEQIDIPSPYRKPDAQYILHGLASIYAAIELNRRGQYREALALCEQVLSSTPTDAAAYVNKGWALIKLGRLEDALNACELAISLHPSNVNIHSAAYANKGWALNALGRHEEARQACEKAILLHPNEVDVYTSAYVHKGWALNALGHHKEALDACEYALGLHSLAADLNATAYVNECWALNALGHPKQALAASEKALSLLPSDMNIVQAAKECRRQAQENI